MKWPSRIRIPGQNRWTYCIVEKLVLPSITSLQCWERLLGNFKSTGALSPISDCLIIILYQVHTLAGSDTHLCGKGLARVWQGSNPIPYHQTPVNTEPGHTNPTFAAPPKTTVQLSAVKTSPTLVLGEEYRHWTTKNTYMIGNTKPPRPQRLHILHGDKLGQDTTRIAPRHARLFMDCFTNVSLFLIPSSFSLGSLGYSTKIAVCSDGLIKP